MAVHHIDMDPVGAGRLDGLDFRAQPGKVGGQDGRRDLTDWPCWADSDGLSAGFGGRSEPRLRP